MKPIYFAGAAIAIAIAIFMVFAGEAPGLPAAPTPTSTGGGDAPRTFTDTFTPGYEGEFYKVVYALRYPASFTATNLPDNKTKIILSEKDGGESVIALVWNGAAGFSSGEEVWEAVGPEKNCTTLTSGLSIPQADKAWYGECGGKVAAAYFDRPSGMIVVASFDADRSVAEEILSNLTITISPTAQPSL